MQKTNEGFLHQDLKKKNETKIPHRYCLRVAKEMNFSIKEINIDKFLLSDKRRLKIENKETIFRIHVIV